MDTLQPTGLRLLVTSRLNAVVAVARGHTVVGNMQRKEAFELLKKKSGAVTLPEAEADQVRCVDTSREAAEIITGKYRYLHR